MVQQVLEAVRVPAPSQQVEQDARVEVAGPGAHDQALERGQPHRGVDGYAAEDRRGRGAVAEVQRHQAQPGEVTAEEPGRLARDVLVADAVHAVAPDACLPGDLPVQGVRRGGGGQAGEPRRVEHGHLRQLGPRALGQPDPGQRRWVVQRGELGEPVQFAERVVVQKRRPGEPAAAVHDPVADRVQVCDTGVAHRLGDLPEGRLVAGLADPLDGPADLGTAAPGIDHAVLQRRRAGVEDQDVDHGGESASGRRRPRTRGASGADGVVRERDYRRTGWDFTYSVWDQTFPSPQVFPAFNAARTTRVRAPRMWSSRTGLFSGGRTTVHMRT